MEACWQRSVDPTIQRICSGVMANTMTGPGKALYRQKGFFP
jgi:hypothetical protein